MDGLTMGMTWKEIAAGLMKDFKAWGCRFDRRKLPVIAMSYDCTTLFSGTGWMIRSSRERSGASCACWATLGGSSWRRTERWMTGKPRPARSCVTKERPDEKKRRKER